MKVTNGNYTNQIDHVLINDKLKHRITDVKTIREADSESDHILVRMKINVRMKRRITKKLMIVDRYDITKFRNAKCCKRFKNKINKLSKYLNIDRIGSIITR